MLRCLLHITSTAQHYRPQALATLEDSRFRCGYRAKAQSCTLHGSPFVTPSEASSWLLSISTLTVGVISSTLPGVQKGHVSPPRNPWILGNIYQDVQAANYYVSETRDPGIPRSNYQDMQAASSHTQCTYECNQAARIAQECCQVLWAPWNWFKFYRKRLRTKGIPSTGFIKRFVPHRHLRAYPRSLETLCTWT